MVVAKCLSAIAPILLASISISQYPSSTSVFGCTLSIALAGVLIGGRAIPPVAGFAAVAYLIAIYFGPAAGQNLGDVITILAANLIIAVLLTLFANAQQQTARTAQQNAARAQQALLTIEAGVEREQLAKQRAGGMADGLMSSSQQQRGAARGAASSLQEVRAQVAELSATAEQIANSARRVRHSSEQTTRQAEDSSRSLASDREQLNRAALAGEQMQSAARQVESRVAQVSHVLALITEIADETHLLSLNATIEAAGAGAAGKRFAVVASEVGKLASKVNTAVAQISELVAAMQGTVQVMLRDATQAVTSVHQSQQSSSTTEQRISELARQVDEVTRESYLIVSSTEQQGKATRLIVSAMEGVSDLSSQTAILSEQLAGTASQLNSLMDELTTEVAPPSTSLVAAY